MELPRREPGDELLKPGEMARLRMRLRVLAPKHDLATVIAYAFARRTRMLPFFGADTMMILTNVDRVSINYGRSDEQTLDHMTLDQARTWMSEGQFPPGSMGPKIEGAIQFLSAARHDNARVIIGPLDRATDAMTGRIGTCITKQ